MDHRGSSARRARLELSVFLLLVAASIVPGWLGEVTQQPFQVTAVATMMQEVALVVLVVYFLWNDREKLTAIGWRTTHAGREVVLGVVLYLPLLVLLSLLARLLGASGLQPTPTPPALVPGTTFDLVLAIVLVVIVAIAEETLFRGYLLLRLREATSSITAAVVLAAVVFAAGHAYEGLGGMIAVGLMGIVFALVYLWRGSLVAPMVMHFLQDFLGIVLLPRLHG